MGKAVADMILEGKSFQDAMNAVFNTVLRTAIETFTRIAIEAAIAQAATEGATGGGGGGGFLGLLGFAEGGVVTKPTVALVGEAGPEAIVPLNKVGGLTQRANITIQQTNNFTMNGNGNGNGNDEHVREIMRKIADVTRSGAAEGAELVKSILSRSDKVSNQSV